MESPLSDLAAALDRAGMHRRFAVDALSVVRGVRRFGLFHTPIEASADLHAALEGAGLEVVAHRELLQYSDPSTREGVLRDPRHGERPNYAELWYAPRGEPRVPDASELFRDPGTWLGYPPCCVAAWEGCKSQRDLYEQYLFRSERGFWDLNRIAAVFQSGLLLPDFYPCTLGCTLAKTFVSGILQAVAAELDAAWAAETTRWMRAPILVYRDTLLAFPSWTRDGDRLSALSVDARRVSLASIGHFPESATHRGTRLLPFDHLEGVRYFDIVAGDADQLAVDLG